MSIRHGNYFWLRRRMMWGMGRNRGRAGGRRSGPSGSGGCLTVLALFLVSSFLLCSVLMNIADLDVAVAFPLALVLLTAFMAFLPVGEKRVYPSKREDHVLSSFDDGSFAKEYFYTDMVKDHRGASIRHKQYTATKITPGEFNFVVAIRVNNEEKEYFFTKSAVSKMSVQFSDVMPGSILLVLHPCFFELGHETGGITSAEAQSSRRFVDYIKRCAGIFP